MRQVRRVAKNALVCFIVIISGGNLFQVCRSLEVGEIPKMSLVETGTFYSVEQKNYSEDPITFHNYHAR